MRYLGGCKPYFRGMCDGAFRNVLCGALSPPLLCSSGKIELANVPGHLSSPAVAPEMNAPPSTWKSTCFGTFLAVFVY